MRWLCFLVLLVIGVVAQAQASDSTIHRRAWRQHHDELTLLAGYHQGRYGFAELGVGRSIYGFVHHPYGMSYYLGAELRADRPELLGVKVCARRC